MYPLPEEEEQSRLVVRIRNGASIPTYEEASVSAKPAAVFIIQAFDVPSTLTSFAFGVGAHPLQVQSHLSTSVGTLGDSAQR